MKMNTLYAALSGAFILGAATLAPAQTTPSEPAKAVQPKSMENKSAGISGDEYKREKDRVEAEAKAAKAKCKDMKDNAKDVCEAEAKANEKVAKKELDWKKNPNDKNKNDLEKMRVEAAYEVAKEKCEDSKDQSQVAKCKKDAKAEKDRNIAALKGSTKRVAQSDTRSSTAAPARSGATIDKPSSTLSGTNTSNTMTPGGRAPSPNTNVQTEGTSTGVAGSPSATGAGMSGTASPKQGKSGQ